MVFRWRANDDPHIVVFGSSLPSSTKKKLSKLDPFLDPLMQLDNYVLCAKSAFMRHATTCYPTLKTARVMKAAALIFMTMYLCLRLILLADRFDPDQARQIFITKALIRMCGTQAELRLCWSHTTKSG